MAYDPRLSKYPGRGPQSPPKPNPKPRVTLPPKKKPESRTERYSRLARNPGTRASVPTEFLSPEHRRLREMNARLNTPVGAGTNVTYRDVGREAQADANVRYGMQEQELRNQFAQSAMQQGRIPQYMEAYKQALQGAQQQATAAWGLAASQARGLGTADAQSSATQNAALVQQMQADAAQRGASVDPNALNTAVQAAGVRQGRNELMAQQADLNQAAENSYYNRGIGNVGIRLVEELGKERGIQNEIGRAQRQLGSEKGEYLTSQRSKLAETYRGAGLENLVFGADQAKAASDAKLADQKLRSDRYDRIQDRKLANSRESRLSAADRRNQERDQYQRDHKLGPYKPASSKDAKLGKPRSEPSSSVTVRRAIMERQGGVADWAKKNHYNLKDKGDRARLVADMRKRHGRDTYVDGKKTGSSWFDNGLQEKALSAAIDLAANGRISKANLRWLRKNNVYVTSDGSYWGGGNRGSR